MSSVRMGGNGQFNGPRRGPGSAPNSSAHPKPRVSGAVLATADDGNLVMYVARGPGHRPVAPPPSAASSESESPAAASPSLDEPRAEHAPPTSAAALGAAPLSPVPRATPRDVAAQVLQALPPDVQAALLEIVQGSGARKPEGVPGVSEEQRAPLDSTVCTPEGEAECGE